MRASLRIASIAAVAVLIAGGAASQSLPPDAVLLPPTMASGLLTQCSRAAPAKAGPTWQPSIADILNLEAELPDMTFRRNADTTYDWPHVPRGWRRQYVGVVRGGHRLIYGNYFPKGAVDDAAWRSQPVLVCDGGGGFFGVEYDADVHHIQRINFNGPY